MKDKCEIGLADVVHIGAGFFSALLKRNAEFCAYLSF
jgi:hypothetical protein